MSDTAPPDTSLEALLAHSVHRSVDTTALLAHLSGRRHAIEALIQAAVDAGEDTAAAHNAVWNTLYEVDPDVHRLVIQGAGGTTDTANPALTASPDMQPLAP